MAWIDDWRIRVKLLAIGVVAMLGMGLLAGAAILSQREQMLMDRTDKIKSLLDVTAGYAKSLQGLVQAGSLSQAEAEARLRAMVHAARYDGTNYIAVYRDDGTAFASPAQPGQEGTSRLDSKDSNGLFIVQVARELVRTQGAGSFSYYFPRAGETTPLRKASFTKALGMGDLFGITGVYVDDVDSALLKRTGSFALIVIPVLALSLGVTLLFNRSISGGLSLLSGAMVRLAKGELAAEVPGAVRGDELGVMARTVLVFRDSGLEKQRLEQQAEADRIEAGAERERQDQERQMLAEEQAAVVRCLGEGLSQLSGGDLTCELQEAFTPRYEQLRADFNAAVSQLRGVMTAIITNTGTIHAGTIEISQAADNLSRRTEQQAASLEQTAAALDEITATVRRAAEGAEQAQRIAAETTADAERSGVVVQSTVRAMGEIETSARQISQIIGVIDEIAFQTNLLALNAGVEAARAGDAGRGFAVVASEVRALAQRSADAAKEIKTLIGASSRQVDQGVKLVGETGVALGRITGQVAQLDRAVTEIAAGAQEQATGLSEVNTAVNQMDQVTQENAAMVEQSTAASQALSQDAAMLAELTGRFRLGEPDSGAGSPGRQAGRGNRASGSTERPSKPRLIAGGRMSGFG